MPSRAWSGVLLVLVVGSSITGCVGKTKSTRPNDRIDGSVADRDSASSQRDASGDPRTPEDIPPVRLARDLTDCPASYRDEAPLSGQHTGFMAGGQTRSFALALPEASFTGPRPLFIAFHGTGGTGAGAISGYDTVAALDRGFVVLAPDGNGNGEIWPVWDALRLPGASEEPNPDLAYLDALVDCVAAHHEIDANRIYAGGVSAGGIMTSFVLQRRSQLLAGGIVASGSLDLTQPSVPITLEPMTVIVTWGGSNDQSSGSAGSVEVPQVSFVEQAAMSSRFWENAPGMHQLYCVGHELGHTWLHPVSSWMLDVLLEHPKGLAVRSGWRLPEVPDGAPVTCSEDVVGYEPPEPVECPSSDVEGCEAYCQLFADCVVENGTARPTLSPLLGAIGFSGSNNRECGGCVEQCAADAAGSDVDAQVLGCFATAAGGPECSGGGIAGLQPLVVAMECCENAQSSQSQVCDRLCSNVAMSDLASDFFPACAAWR